MGRYIDADKFLKDEIRRCGCVPLVGSCTTDNESLAYQLAKASTADVVEVKHGKWIERYRGLCPREKVIVCNLCGRTTEIKEPYCHCGAKMDGAKMSKSLTGSERRTDDDN